MTGKILILFCAIIIAAPAIPAPKLTLCKEEDSPCLTKTANIVYKLAIQRVPELNIENLDPMHQDKIQGDLTGLKYELSNTTIKGSKNCDVLNMKLDLTNSKLYLEMICPYLDMFGLYDVSGKILSIPITGNGDYRIQCTEKVLQLVNKNWKLVVNELQGPVFSANLKKLVKNFNKYLKSVPLDQILVDF